MTAPHEHVIQRFSLECAAPEAAGDPALEMDEGRHNDQRQFGRGGPRDLVAARPPCAGGQVRATASLMDPSSSIDARTLTVSPPTAPRCDPHEKYCCEEERSRELHRVRKHAHDNGAEDVACIRHRA